MVNSYDRKTTCIFHPFFYILIIASICFNVRLKSADLATNGDLRGTSDVSVLHPPGYKTDYITADCRQGFNTLLPL